MTSKLDRSDETQALVNQGRSSPDYCLYSENELLDSSDEVREEGGSVENWTSKENLNSSKTSTPVNLIEVPPTQPEPRPTRLRRKVLPGQVNDLNPPETEAQILAEKIQN